MMTRRELIGLVVRTVPVLPLAAALGTAPAVDAWEITDTPAISGGRFGIEIVASNPTPLRYIRYQIHLEDGGKLLAKMTADEPFHFPPDATREEMEQAFTMLAEELWKVGQMIPGMRESHERWPAEAGW